jgi:Polyketide cyclase / dehydrase and lipid transport
MADAESTVSVTRAVNAPAEHAWALVSDVTRMGEWSPETTAAEWLGGATGPAHGAKFRGSNRNGAKSWKSVATIVDATPGRAFAFRVKAMGFDVAEWRYTFEPTPTGCVVTECWTDRRGALLRVMSPRATGVADRAEHNRGGMEKTLERLATAAESTSPSP